MKIKDCIGAALCIQVFILLFRKGWRVFPRPLAKQEVRARSHSFLQGERGFVDKTEARLAPGSAQF